MKMYTKIIEEINPLMLIASLMILSFAFTVSAEDELDDDIETVTIIGSQSDVAGVASVITNEDLQKVMDTDIHKILSAVPGLYFRTEDNIFENKFIKKSSLRPVESSYGHCAANPGNDKNFEKQLDKNIKELLN